ncbi:hypothetical protein Bsp3421_000772 [Burkholderia sp. FERM BP-3421]|uniref:hypothetical protein n=1 Tax=Burkholderia sp. FERM BP-3421 TaxID=1494466 RepID=UPI0023605632|nr:hypothetical protein [Burkholderia sp. FERM BP-3421]WDD90891.1 hypothetical protein Bsp3421_000772 [Burkholderia sp. FERM BP-3421]
MKRLALTIVDALRRTAEQCHSGSHAVGFVVVAPDPLAMNGRVADSLQATDRWEACHMKRLALTIVDALRRTAEQCHSGSHAIGFVGVAPDPLAMNRRASRIPSRPRIDGRLAT